MTAAVPSVRYVFSVDLTRLYPQMVVLSVVVHVAAVIAFVLAPQWIGQAPQKFPEKVEVDLRYDLPKGPGLGPMAPDRDQAAIRESDPRKAAEIMKDRAEAEKDIVKLTTKRDNPTNKLGFKDRQRMEAIERLREKRAIMDSVGGGGNAVSSNTGVMGIYIAKLQSQILSVWSLPGGLDEEYLKKTVVIRIYLSSTGAVVKAVLERPSGFEPLDRSCDSAIKKASPLPAPPSLLADELKSKGIAIRFHGIDKKRP